MKEGFDQEGYYHAIINGQEIVFESWQAWQDYIAEDEPE